jgi:hypothetical protein
MSEKISGKGKSRVQIFWRVVTTVYAVAEVIRRTDRPSDLTEADAKKLLDLWRNRTTAPPGKPGIPQEEADGVQRSDQGDGVVMPPAWIRDP